MQNELDVRILAVILNYWDASYEIDSPGRSISEFNELLATDEEMQPEEAKRWTQIEIATSPVLATTVCNLYVSSEFVDTGAKIARKTCGPYVKPEGSYTQMQNLFLAAKWLFENVSRIPLKELITDSSDLVPRRAGFPGADTAAQSIFAVSGTYGTPQANPDIPLFSKEKPARDFNIRIAAVAVITPGEEGAHLAVHAVSIPRPW